MGRYDGNWPRRPFDKHRHLCQLCAFGVVMWTGEEECRPLRGCLRKGRKMLGKREVQRRLAELGAFDAAREQA
jgi:hypothetical protein